MIFNLYSKQVGLTFVSRISRFNGLNTEILNILYFVLSMFLFVFCMLHLLF